MMAGGLFAGHDQCEGEIIEKNGKKLKIFYGMSSDTAMKKHAGNYIRIVQCLKDGSKCLPINANENKLFICRGQKRYFVDYVDRRKIHRSDLKCP